MNVARDNIREVIESLNKESFLGVDTETTGLGHNDQLFSIVLAAANTQYYLNFNDNEDIPGDYILDREVAVPLLNRLFANPDLTIFCHNLSFDLDFLTKFGVKVQCHIFCTLVKAKMLNNTHGSYNLDTVSQRAGFPAKDDRVMEYLNEHKLWVKGDNKRKRYFFNKVPFKLISEYACTDAELTRRIGLWQMGLNNG